jgi:hypothetical protein
VKWAGSRDKIFSPSGRGSTFFLTSLFIELIENSGRRKPRPTMLESAQLSLSSSAAQLQLQSASKASARGSIPLTLARSQDGVPTQTDSFTSTSRKKSAEIKTKGRLNPSSSDPALN